MNINDLQNNTALYLEEKGAEVSFKCSVTNGYLVRGDTVDNNLIPNKIWWTFSDLYSVSTELGECTYAGDTFVCVQPSGCETNEICEQYV